jgi:Holliday junction resolvase RusA-like endonuclease
MSESVRIVVEGVPAPKGSFRISSRGRGRKPIVRKDSPKTERWERVVAQTAQVAMAGRARFVDVPLRVVVYFRMPRPLGHYGKRGLLASKANAVPAVKPDIDKLLRSTFDPLEGIVFDQDSRIVEVLAHKGYVQDGETPGAVVTVWAGLGQVP